MHIDHNELELLQVLLIKFEPCGKVLWQVQGQGPFLEWFSHHYINMKDHFTHIQILKKVPLKKNDVIQQLCCRGVACTKFVAKWGPKIKFKLSPNYDGKIGTVVN